MKHDLQGSGKKFVDQVERRRKAKGILDKHRANQEAATISKHLDLENVQGLTRQINNFRKSLNNIKTKKPLPVEKKNKKTENVPAIKKPSKKSLAVIKSLTAFQKTLPEPKEDESEEEEEEDEEEEEGEEDYVLILDGAEAEEWVAANSHVEEMPKHEKRMSRQSVVRHHSRVRLSLARRPHSMPNKKFSSSALCSSAGSLNGGRKTMLHWRPDALSTKPNLNGCVLRIPCKSWS